MVLQLVGKVRLALRRRRTPCLMLGLACVSSQRCQCAATAVLHVHCGLVRALQEAHAHAGFPALHTSSIYAQVFANKMQKSVIVIVELKRWVNKYQGWHVYLRKYMAHDSADTCNVGDVVKIEQLPARLSNRKAFNVVEILQRERIVLDSGDGPQAPAEHGAQAFQRRPAWAGLSGVTADAVERTCEEYGRYYNVAARAAELAPVLGPRQGQRGAGTPPRSRGTQGGGRQGGSKAQVASGEAVSLRSRQPEGRAFSVLKALYPDR